MKPVPMRFGGVQWHHNPREISFESEKQINELLSPCNGAVLQNTGRHGMIIRGEGELYGADCLEQFERLLALYKKGGDGVLSVSGLKPIFAVFESIKLIGRPRPDVITYRFVFREVMLEKDRQTEYVTAEGENLWDVSYRFGIAIDSLVALNPQIKRPDIVEKGEVIRLA